MTQQEKQLLLTDLSSRLPYGVICHTEKGDGHLCSINQTIFGTEYGFNISPVKRDYFNEDEVVIKPYLRPMSSMTEEEENEWNKLQVDPLLENALEKHTKEDSLKLIAKSEYGPVDWLNAHHFDYRGLIEKEFALEAHEGMYKEE